MPTCPGCRRRLDHDEMLEHLRLCKWVWSDRPGAESRWCEQLARSLRERT